MSERKLAAGDLMGLEAYARVRPEYRARVLAHKVPRRIAIGAHATLSFEDRLTVQYQIQEMLRIERIFEPDGIQSELDAYNPLIPDGTNLKATLLIEYPDPAERAVALERLRGLEHACHLEVGGHRVMAVADEDLERANDQKTSAVHFLRFELGAGQRAAFRAGPVVIGFDHPHYAHATTLSAASRAALAEDLDP